MSSYVRASKSQQFNFEKTRKPNFVLLQKIVLNFAENNFLINTYYNRF